MPLLSKSIQLGQASKLESISLPGFGGGLNAVESDISMQPQYQVALQNFRRTAGGSQETRFGSNWFADVVSVVTGDIVDSVVFANAIITVTDTGQIAATDLSGNVVAIWNTAIANALPGTPAGWSGSLDSIDFVPFRSQLVVHNGVDKPITIDENLDVTYLADLATGSNVYTPIGKYGCVVSNYHCVAGIPAAPTTVYVSNKGTSGTFTGDALPNDAIAIDVGAYAPEGAPEIRGIAGFRSYLIVFFAEQSLLIRLGIYNDATPPVHIPEFPDTLPNVGILGHRCVVQVINDLRFAGFSNVNSAKRNLFGQIDGDTLSDIIEPAYRRAVGVLTDNERLKRCFVVFDSISHDTSIYVPDGTAFVYCNNEKLKTKAWTMFTGPAWRSGCASTLGRVFFTIGSRIFQQGNTIFAGEKYRADRLNDRDANWTTGHAYSIDDIARDTVTAVSYICIADHISGGTTFANDRAAQVLAPKWEEYTGEGIDILMELPWIAGKDPMQLKQNRFLGIGSGGTAEFTVKVWVDNLYKDDDGEVIYDPALTMAFIGNDALGFGYDAGPYGGGRRSTDPRLFKFPINFKTIKIQFSGSVKKRLELASASFLYARGRWKR